jgi:hypothetical protein
LLVNEIKLEKNLPVQEYWNNDIKQLYFHFVLAGFSNSTDFYRNMPSREYIN